MKKKQGKWKQKMRQLWSYSGVVGVAILGLLLVIEGVIGFTLLARWDSGGVREYQGEYTVHEKMYIRNINYVFCLGNGDVLRIPPEYIVNDAALADYSELNFCYSEYKSLFRGTHTGVSITTTDGTEVFLQAEYSRKMIRFEAVFFMSMGLLVVSVSILPWVGFRVLERKYFSNKRQKQRRKNK